MPTFVCVDHDGVWVAGSSVVDAADERSARRLLDAVLTARGLKPFADWTYTLQLVPPDTAVLISDGNITHEI